MIPTRSIESTRFPDIVKVPHGSFGKRNPWFPPQAVLELLVAVTASLIVGGAAIAIERRRQLAFRPGRVAFPSPAEDVEDPVRYREGAEFLSVFLVEAQDMPAAGNIVVDDIYSFSVYPGRKARKNA